MAQRTTLSGYVTCFVIGTITTVAAMCPGKPRPPSS